MKPTQLPVYKQKNKILKQLKKNQVIVVESPTGSGKTTQLPQILYQAGYSKEGMIGVTQPRRIAAVSVSEFIARQLGKEIPELVGFKMRFEDCTDNRTLIKIMTDGTLLQEIKTDENLSRYKVIIVDEAHERSLNIDFILGLLKRILKARPDFKVIISSATINAKIFSDYFDKAPIVTIKSQIFPIKEFYEPPVMNNNLEELIDLVSGIVDRRLKENQKGDILIFLSGEKAIKMCIASLESLDDAKKLEILPLYSRLSTEDQEKVFKEFKGKIKVIVATNIAETSVTIDGITAVIDSGFAKMNYYNPRSFTSSLVEVPISQAACRQRKGRAGRTRPGICYRLYTKEDFESREEYTLEEIFRTDLSEVVLRMAELGIKNFETFDFLSQPSQKDIRSAVDTLLLLEAIDKDRNLTDTGRLMVQFPMSPRHSRCIIEAIKVYPNVMEEVLVACSFLTTNSPFLLPHGEEMSARAAHHFFRSKAGDFVSYLKIFRQFHRAREKEEFCERYYLDYKTMREISNIKYQLEEIVGDLGVPLLSGGPISEYLCALSKGLIQFVCRRSGRGEYSSLTADKIHIHPGSVMFSKNPDFIVAGEIMKTSRIFARSVSSLEKEWLPRISPMLQDLLEQPKSRHKDKKERTEDKGRDKDKKRDFTNQIKIGKEVFPVKKLKGRQKQVVMQWEKLKPNLSLIDNRQLSQYKGLRGKIMFQGMEIFSDSKLSAILVYAHKIDFNKGVLQRFPLKNYSAKEKPTGLIDFLDHILRLVHMKKKSRQLGFLGLASDGKGTYWYHAYRAFQSALTDSLASLEVLADQSQEWLSQADLVKVNEVYRMLDALIAEE
ncbi:MAG: ATP-dependent RNA helicase [Spirochaetales bacterium]|nr:ATP-dependent RNA helicase [Spirochaetales bacterium]